jgi:hypothetical protein
MDADLPYVMEAVPGRSPPTLVELPPHWSLDDGEQYAWLPGIWDIAAIEGPDKLLRMWEMDFAGRSPASARASCSRRRPRSRWRPRRRSS